MPLPSKPCKFCHSETHWSYTCFKNPKVANPRPLKRTAIAKRGRVSKATDSAVDAWKRTQKPNHQGYHQCHYCKAWITYLMAEHMESKVRRPDLRTVHSNYVPVCSLCNESKRSKSHDEIEHSCNL